MFDLVGGRVAFYHDLRNGVPAGYDAAVGAAEVIGTGFLGTENEDSCQYEQWSHKQLLLSMYLWKKYVQP
jgi:hypothetical protein